MLLRIYLAFYKYGRIAIIFTPLIGGNYLHFGIRQSQRVYRQPIDLKSVQVNRIVKVQWDVILKLRTSSIVNSEALFFMLCLQLKLSDYIFSDRGQPLYISTRMGQCFSAMEVSKSDRG